MPKVFVVYDSKYGNTKIAAESILEGIKEVEGIETAIGYVKEVDAGKVVNYDLIVLGAPNHMGRPSRSIKKFVDKLAKLDRKARALAVFGTYAGKTRTVDRAVKKLRKIVEKNMSDLHFISPSLSIKVYGVTGPIVEDEFPNCRNFGKRIANQLKNM